MKVLLDLDLNQDDLSKFVTNQNMAATNSIAMGIVEIVRMPSPGIRVPGVSKGDTIHGRVVLQHVGPLKVSFPEYAKKTRPGKAKKKRKLAPSDGVRRRTPRSRKRGLSRRAKEA